MVCYARWAYSLVGVVLVGFLLLGQPAAHFLAVEALMVSLSIVIGGAALAAALAVITFRSVQRRRALAGGCTGCQFKCQHAMTVPHRPTRMWLATSVDRGAPATSRTPALAPVPTLAPTLAPEREVVMLPTPRWPDRPLRAETPPEQVRVPVRA